MAVQLIRKVCDRQPQGRVEIDWENPITRGIVDIIWSGNGPARYLVGLVKPTVVGNINTTTAGIGRQKNATANAAVRFHYSPASVNDRFRLYNGITLLTYGSMPRTGTASASTGVEYGFQISNRYGTGYVYGSCGGVSLEPGTRWLDKIALRGLTYSSPSLRLYEDGIVVGSSDSGTTPSYDASYAAPIVCASGNTSTLDTALWTGIWSRALSGAELKSLSANPWQIFEPETIPLFYSTAGGATNLSIFDALHNHAGDNLAFSLDTYLAAQDSTHAHAADNLTLDASTAISLVLSDALHGLSSDVIAFITGSYIELADSLHGHSADALALATASFIAVADALHSHSADNLTLDTSNATPLTLQDTTHAHSTDNNLLTLDTWLTIVEAVHAHLADNVSISSEELLAIADALHSLASDALVLTLPSPPGTCPTVDEIKVAVWQHIIESGVSAEAMLRIVSAVLAGKVNGANTGVETFVGIDGVTNRVVSTVDSVGNRTSVSVDGS